MRPELRAERAASGGGPRSRGAVAGTGAAGGFQDGARRIELLVQRRLPIFGVCLGLQGIVEYFGGSLDVLDVPMHGKPSLVRALGGRLLGDLPREFTVGRYHSLHARRSALPPALSITAETEDRVIMAIEHVSHVDRRRPVSPRIGDDLATRSRDAGHQRRPVDPRTAGLKTEATGQKRRSTASRRISTGKRERSACVNSATRSVRIPWFSSSERSTVALFDGVSSTCTSPSWAT